MVQSSKPTITISLGLCEPVGSGNLSFLPVTSLFVLCPLENVIVSKLFFYRCRWRHFFTFFLKFSHFLGIFSKKRENFISCVKKIMFMPKKNLSLLVFFPFALGLRPFFKKLCLSVCVLCDISHFSLRRHDIYPYFHLNRLKFTSLMTTK